MKPVFAVAKRELLGCRAAFFTAVAVMLLATTDADASVALSRGNYALIAAVMAPFFVALRDWPRLLCLGASKRDYFAGSLLCYGAIAGLVSLANTLVRLLVDPLAGRPVVNLMELCGWWGNGPFLAFLQQAAFLLCTMLFLHALLFVQGRFSGWAADAALAAVLGVFLPIAPLRGMIARFFGLVMMNAHAVSQLAACLALCVAFALAGLSALRRWTD